MKTNDVLSSFASKGVSILTKKIDRNEFILIEGNRESLKALGTLLTTLADDKPDSLQLGPKSAGNAFFKEGSTIGFYFRRIGN